MKNSTPYIISKLFSTIVDNALAIKTRRDIPIIARLTVTEKTSIFTELLQVSNFFDFVYWQIENCPEFNNTTIFKIHIYMKYKELLNIG